MLKTKTITFNDNHNTNNLPDIYDIDSVKKLIFKTNNPNYIHEIFRSKEFINLTEVQIESKDVVVYQERTPVMNQIIVLPYTVNKLILISNMMKFNNSNLVTHLKLINPPDQEYLVDDKQQFPNLKRLSIDSNKQRVVRLDSLSIPCLNTLSIKSNNVTIRIEGNIHFNLDTLKLKGPSFHIFDVPVCYGAKNFTGKLIRSCNNLIVGHGACIDTMSLLTRFYRLKVIDLRTMYCKWFVELDTSGFHLNIVKDNLRVLLTWFVPFLIIAGVIKLKLNVCYPNSLKSVFNLTSIQELIIPEIEQNIKLSIHKPDVLDKYLKQRTTTGEMVYKKDWNPKDSTDLIIIDEVDSRYNIKWVDTFQIAKDELKGVDGGVENNIVNRFKICDLLLENFQEKTINDLKKYIANNKLDSNTMIYQNICLLEDGSLNITSEDDMKKNQQFISKIRSLTIKGNIPRECMLVMFTYMPNLSFLCLKYMSFYYIPSISKLKTLVFDQVIDDEDESELFSSIAMIDTLETLRISKMTKKDSHDSLCKRLKPLFEFESKIESLAVRFAGGTEQDIEELLLYIKDNSHIKLKRLFLQFNDNFQASQEFTDDMCTRIINRLVYINHIYISGMNYARIRIQLRKNKND